MAIETVSSELLSDPPPAPVEKPTRAVSKDYTDSLRDGFTESLEAFSARLTARQLAGLDLAAIFFFATVALTGRRYLRRTR
ncbi:hypothetical protein ACWGHA_11000 [Streptomyces xanthophaeus]